MFFGNSEGYVDIEDSFVEADDGESEATPGQDLPTRFDRYIVFDGVRMLKSRALSLYAKRRGNFGPSSTDRLKRVQEVERYSGLTPLSYLNGTAAADSLQENPLLAIQDPVATVVRCQGSLGVFLCIGEVNGIKINTDSTITAIPQSDLRELEKVTVSVQILGLRPALTTPPSGMIGAHIV